MPNCLADAKLSHGEPGEDNDRDIAVPGLGDLSPVAAMWDTGH